MSMYGRTDHRLECLTDGRTKQASKDECDVNLIMSKYTRTGLISHLALGMPKFADVSELTDYRSAVDNIRSVEAFFAGLPSAVRRHFENDPALLMERMEAGLSADDLKAIGLEVLEGSAKPEPELVAPEVPPVETPPAAPVTPPAA